MQDNDFSPDTIDAQTAPDAANLPAEDARLLRDLHRLHQPIAAKNAASLARVQARLQERASERSEQQALAAKQTFKRPLAQPSSPLTYIKEHRMSTNEPANRSGLRPRALAEAGPRHSRSRWSLARSGHLWRRLGVIAASLLLVTLAGSMVAVLALAHQGKSLARTGTSSVTATAAAVTATAAPEPTPAAGTYIISANTFYSDQVSKLDPQTKQPLWTQPVGAMGNALSNGSDPYAGTATPALVVYGDTIYVSSGDADPSSFKNYVYAINATTGALRWKALVDNDPPQDNSGDNLGALSTPTAAAGIVYISGRDGKLYALNGATGAPLWTYDAHTTTLVNGFLSDANQALINQSIVYGAVHNVLYALDASSGKPLWTKQIAASQLFNAPQMVDGTLYLSSRAASHGSWPEPQGSFLYAYAGKDGRQIWQHAVDSWVLAAPTVVNGVVYFGCYDYRLYALKASDGSQLWSYNTGGEIFEQPLVADGIVYTDEQGTLTPGSNSPPPNSDATWLFAINASSGALVWQQSIENLLSLQQVQDSAIYVGIWPGQLAALSVKDGSVLWQQHYGAKLIDKTGTESESPPSVTIIS